MSSKVAYKIIDKLGESIAAEVFRAETLDAKASQLRIKRIRPKFILAGVKEHLEQQQSYLHRLALADSDLTTPILQIGDDLSLSLIQSLPLGQPLNQWLASKPAMDITTLLEIGIALADCLAIRHQAALIHKGVKPGNIFIQENPIRVQLVDEIKVLDSGQLSQFIQDEHYLRESLPYLSPEQTGRIRSDVGYSSDLYALGAVLYQCATGQPPFVSEDPLSIIHSHLAEIPDRVDKLNSECPTLIGDIIVQLLEKVPERRYQTAKGLKTDLQTCLDAWKSEQFIPAFTLKQKDHSEQIILPSIMVGRDHERQRLLDEYRRVCEGSFGVAMITGPSGIGKTRLVQELELPIVAQHGYYSSGKFNQFTKHLPYSTLVQALEKLIRLFLTEDEERLSYWKQRILNVVGISGQLMIDLVPELELIIGPQPEVTPLPPKEAHNRFNDLFYRFIACLASKAHPLVLFIDDLQWCDNATFDLFELIFSRAQECPYLFIIGAYRNNEVDAQHRVSAMTQDLDITNPHFFQFHLEPLDRPSVNKITAFVLNTYSARTEELNEVIFPASGGNPLFVNEIIRWLHKQKRLFLGEDGNWSWDASALEGLKLPDSAKGLFRAKLAQLPNDVIELLTTAAMLGARFDAADLALASKLSVDKLFTKLNEVFAQRILLHEKNELYFFHDQLQAAAASFLNKEQKRQCHAKIARSLISQLPKQKKQHYKELSSSKTFQIVEQLAAGRSDDSSEASRFEEARLNYMAGEAAMDSLALESSYHYFGQAAQLCSNDRWQSEYDFMSALHKKLARAALINGDQARAELVVNSALEHAESDLDRAELLYEQVVVYASLGDVITALSCANKVLALLGTGLPQGDEATRVELAAIATEIHNDDIWQKLEVAPVNSDRRATIELQLYEVIAPLAFMSGQPFATMLMGARTVKSTLAHGVSAPIAHALEMTALYFQIQGDYKTSSRYEAQALKLANRDPHSFGSVRAIGAGLWLTFYMRRSASELNNIAQQNMENSLLCGELNYAGFAYFPLVWYSFAQGEDLSGLQTKIEHCIRFAQRNHLALPLCFGEAAQLALTSLWDENSELNNEKLIAEKLNQWQEKQAITAIACYYIFKAMVDYYNESFTQAEQHLSEAQPYLAGVSNLIAERFWVVFRYLTSRQTGNDDAEIKDYINQTAIWTEQGPLLKPYLALMHAETIAKQGDWKSTRNAYLDAIEIAHHERYTLLEGFLYQRLASLCDENQLSSSLYWNESLVLYRRCGAEAKIKQLKERLGQKPSFSSDSKFSLIEELDTHYLIDATKMIMQEKNYDLLLQSILSAAMQRLGAKSGYLLIYQEGDLQLCVKGIKNTDVHTELYDHTVGKAENFCIEIARFVLRTEEMLVLENASEQGDFSHIDSVRESHLKSVLCAPLVNQGRLLGILYLENNLIPAVFTTEQIELIRLLSAQAAIAVDHTLLVDQLRQREENLSITLDSIGDGVIVTDAVGDIVRINPVAEKMTAWTSDEAFGQTVHTVFPIIDATTRRPIPNPVDEVLSTGKTVLLRNHTTLISKEGREYQISDSAAPILDADENVRGMVLVFNDVTEQYRLRMETAKARRDLQAIMDHSPAVVFVKDIEGRYLFINQQYEKLFNIKRAAILGKTDYDLFDNDFADEFRRNDQYVLDTGHALEIEEDAPQEDGIHDYISIKFPLFDDAGSIYAVCGISTDITDRKKQEEQLRQTMKMDALGKLTGGIAHDYNNMLGVIIGYADLIKRENYDQPEVSQYANEISRAGKRAAKLTQKLLSFSRHKQTSGSKVNINNFLHEEQDLLEKTLTIRIKLSLDLEDELWPVWLDEGDLEDVILNMSINAMHAMENKGKLMIQTRNETLNSIDAQFLELEPGDYVRLSITDTGKGMSKEEQTHIFEPFFSTKGDKGTGLGLSQVYGFVQRSGGAIKVYSESGKGSRFVMYFPRFLIKTVKSEKTKENSLINVCGNETVLVVDDEPGLNTLTCKILEKNGYKTLSASDGVKALQILEKESVNLVISDAIMPNMDGYELYAKIKDNYPDIKVQLMSGFNEEKNPDAENEQLDVMQKPVNTQALLSRIRELLDS